jgi:cyclopropane fatty-acyl-phospholipid synthase-like methyltransferase
MSDNGQHVVDFVSRHPISREQILIKLRARRGGLDDLRPEDLYPYDQDHYGGLAADDALAELARIGPGTRVADFCAGLGGPARYLAHRYGAVVIGIELTPARVEGAEDLTRRVGLQDRVQVRLGDVARAPLGDGAVDVVVSQEALLHVPDKSAALAEAFRVLQPGGRLVFTDWVSHRQLSAEEAEEMWRGIAAQMLQNLNSYRGLLEQAGFRVRSVEDLTESWGTLLAERLTMYQALRQEALHASAPAGDEAFYRAYARLVELVKGRVLGGGRFAAEKP